jgi:hypothetical protein
MALALPGTLGIRAALILSMRCGMSEAFVVALHNGYWRIGYMDQWYGTYPSKSAAQKAAVMIAKGAGELPTQVIVQDADGTEALVWEPTARSSGGMRSP